MNNYYTFCRHQRLKSCFKRLGELNNITYLLIFHMGHVWMTYESLFKREKRKKNSFWGRVKSVSRTKKRISRTRPETTSLNFALQQYFNKIKNFVQGWKTVSKNLPVYLKVCKYELKIENFCKNSCGLSIFSHRVPAGLKWYLIVDKSLQVQSRNMHVNLLDRVI